MYKYRFSIFTATFNRGHLLHRVYDCLLKQTYKNFEWIIVDDGSTDNTEEVCQQFISEQKLNIKYTKKTNEGKHTAWKIATTLFEGKYELGADDDDIFPDNTLEIFNKYWQELEQQPNYNDFWEIRGQCADSTGRPISKRLPTKIFDSDYNIMTFKYKYKKEMQGCRKVSVLKKEAAVPEHFYYDDKVSNFPEGIRWSRAAKKYKTRFISEIVRIYLTTENSLCSSSYGKNRSIKKSYNRLVGSLYLINEQRTLMLKHDLSTYIRHILTISYQSICTKEFPIKCLNSIFDKLLVLLSFIPCSLIYLIRK